MPDDSPPDDTSPGSAYPPSWNVAGDSLFYRVLLLSMLGHLAILTVLLLHPTPADLRALAIDDARPRHVPALVPGSAPPELASTALAHPSPAAASPPAEAPPSPEDSTAPRPLKNKPARPSSKPSRPRKDPAEPEAPRSQDDAARSPQATPPTQRSVVAPPPLAEPKEAASPTSPSAPNSSSSTSSDAAGTAPASAEGAYDQHAAGSAPTPLAGPLESVGEGRPGSNEDTDALRAAYLQRLVPDIAGRHFYPQNARRLGLEGRVLIALTIDAHGTIVALDVYRSSGHRALDDAALTALRRLPRLSPPPAALLTHDRLRVIVPMTYRLSGDPS